MASERDKGPSTSEPRDRRMRRRKPEPGDRRMKRASGPEEKRRRLVVILVGAFLLSGIAAVAIYGYYDAYIVPPKVLAARVGDKKYTQGDLVKRMRVLQADSTAQGQTLDFGREPFNILSNMAEAEIIRRASPGYNIRVTDDEIELGLMLRFGPRVPEGQEVAEGQLEREFKENYLTFLNTRHLSDSDYRQLVEEGMYRAKLRTKLGEQLPTVAEQLEVNWIQLAHETASFMNAPQSLSPEEVRELLETEKFTDVARAHSIDRAFANENGYVGWVPEGAFPLLDPYLFGNEEIEALDLDELSLPVSTPDATYIFKVTAGPETREISDIMLSKLSDQALTNWLSEQKAIGGKEGWLELKFNSDLYAWVNQQVREALPRGITLTPLGGR